jgi:putative phosphoribosyl transferase
MGEVSIQLNQVTLQGDLVIPPEAKGLVVFAHGSGSGRMSPRNQYVAHVLQQQNLATLLLDLLTPEEEIIDNDTRQFRFDIPLLAQRLVEVVHWARQHSDLGGMRIGFFGASTGSAAALIATALLVDEIDAVVSRGGRTDLAMNFITKVTAPTLLIVGGADTDVIQMNEKSFTQLSGKKKMEIVADATHLFEEPGALEAVSELAVRWFTQYLQR